MPYRLHWERPFGVLVQHFGTIVADDLAALAEIVSGDEGFDDLRYWIADFREAASHEFDLLSPGKFEPPFATLIGASHTNPHIHCAFICVNPAIEEAIRMAIDRHLLPFEARVFRTEMEARDWIGGVSNRLRQLPLS